MSNSYKYLETSSILILFPLETLIGEISDGSALFLRWTICWWGVLKLKIKKKNFLKILKNLKIKIPNTKYFLGNSILYAKQIINKTWTNITCLCVTNWQTKGSLCSNYLSPNYLSVQGIGYRLLFWHSFLDWDFLSSLNYHWKKNKNKIALSD